MKARSEKQLAEQWTHWMAVKLTKRSLEVGLRSVYKVIASFLLRFYSSSEAAAEWCKCTIENEYIAAVVIVKCTIQLQQQKPHMCKGLARYLLHIKRTWKKTKCQNGCELKIICGIVNENVARKRYVMCMLLQITLPYMVLVKSICIITLDSVWRSLCRTKWTQLITSSLALNYVFNGKDSTFI